MAPLTRPEALVNDRLVMPRAVSSSCSNRTEPTAALLHPVGAVILGLLGPGAVTAFAVLHGAGNGLLTIGILGAPARATQAASPLLFGLLMDYMGIGVIAVSAGLSLSACVALLLLKARPATAPAPA